MAKGDGLKITVPASRTEIQAINLKLVMSIEFCGTDLEVTAG